METMRTDEDREGRGVKRRVNKTRELRSVGEQKKKTIIIITKKRRCVQWRM